MRRMILLITLLLVLFATQPRAQLCVFSWDPSVSNNVESYSFYRYGDKLATKIKGLEYSMPCIIGNYYVTTTNTQKIESKKSKKYRISRPLSATNLEACKK